MKKKSMMHGLFIHLFSEEEKKQNSETHQKQHTYVIISDQ